MWSTPLTEEEKAKAAFLARLRLNTISEETAAILEAEEVDEVSLPMLTASDIECMRIYGAERDKILALGVIIAKEQA